jgi:dipeptidase E
MIHIFAIGGGELGWYETYALDRQLVESLGVECPRVLFFPTASGDPTSYIHTFREVYQGRLGCQVESLELVAGSPSGAEIEEKIEAADLVYVGGGNTSLLLRTWRSYGVDQLLQRAAERGTTLSGLSAGAICWFQWAHSHADLSPHPVHLGAGRYLGLELLPGTCAPHFAQQIWRWQTLRTLLHREGGLGIGLDDNMALEVRGSEYRILAAQKDRLLRRLEFRDGVGTLEEHHPHEDWRPLESLLGQLATP